MILQYTYGEIRNLLDRALDTEEAVWTGARVQMYLDPNWKDNFAAAIESVIKNEIDINVIITVTLVKTNGRFGIIIPNNLYEFEFENVDEGLVFQLRYVE